jgi:hypothetical protein
MTKNFEKYLNSRFCVACAMLALFFGMMVRPDEEAIWNCAQMEMGRATECLLAKYENLRFAYRLAVQLKQLSERETAAEKQQKVRKVKLNRELSPNDSMIGRASSLAGL